MANDNLTTRPGNIDQINEKVLKYETFLSERLRPDLKAALEERDKLYAETAEFLALKNSIEAIKATKLQPGEPLKTKVDLGSNFYCQAVVPNPSRIIIEVGLGMLLSSQLIPYFTVDSRDKAQKSLSIIVKYQFLFVFRLLCRVYTRRRFSFH